MKNLFNLMKFYISNPKGRKQFSCKKDDFCDCTQDLDGVCTKCIETIRMKYLKDKCKNFPETTS